MNRSRRLSACLACSFMLLAVGCNRQDADRLAKLGAKVEQRVEGLGNGGQGRFDRSWQAVPFHWGDVAVDARVSARLHWDKTLGDAAIQVQVVDGVVELHGQVRDVQHKRHAVEVAEATLGVEKVADRLEVRGP
jgi:BON domain-containing protein